MFLCDKAFETQARGLLNDSGLNVQVKVISAGKVRRYAHLTFLQHFTVKGLMWSNFKDMFKIIRGFFESVAIIRHYKPDVVFTKGGYVCLPVGAAAHFLRVPLVIHDSDTRPGLTNKLLSRWADTIATGSPLENYTYPAGKSYYTGVPIGPNFRPKTQASQRAYKVALGFKPNKLLVVAVGGGLGAKSINAAMNRAAKTLLEQGIGAYVIAGKGHYEQAKELAPDDANYKVVPFVYKDIDHILGAADIVVSRGSATFLQELAGLGKAVIIVPARQLGDQLKNAQAFKVADAAVIVDDDGIESDDRLEKAIIELAEDAVMRDRLGKRLHSFARPKATKELAALITAAAKR